MADYTFDPQSDSHLLIAINKAKFDASSVGEFKQQLESSWTPTITSVDIDFGKVEFIDSSGIGALLSVQKRLSTSSQPIRLLNAKPNVVSVIELLRLHRVFSVGE